jgi:hypothetical protein
MIATADDEQLIRANDLAMQIATAELLRLVIGELCFDDNRLKFRTRLAALEDAANKSFHSRRHFPQANDETEEYMKEAACGFVTRLIASIKHPTDYTLG